MNGPNTERKGQDRFTNMTGLSTVALDEERTDDKVERTISNSGVASSERISFRNKRGDRCGSYKRIEWHFEHICVSFSFISITFSMSFIAGGESGTEDEHLDISSSSSRRIRAIDFEKELKDEYVGDDNDSSIGWPGVFDV